MTNKYSVLDLIFKQVPSGYDKNEFNFFYGFDKGQFYFFLIKKNYNNLFTDFKKGDNLDLSLNSNFKFMSHLIFEVKDSSIVTTKCRFDDPENFSGLLFFQEMERYFNQDMLDDEAYKFYSSIRLKVLLKFRLKLVCGLI